MNPACYSDLPKFKYHPIPFSSGALQETLRPCACCGKTRGFLYEGPVYCTEAIEGVCPWCIADGSAHEKWNAQFTDATFFDSHGDHVDLPEEVVTEVLQRTLGVVGALQPIQWWVHCGVPAEFLRVEDERVRFRCSVCKKLRSYRDAD